MAATPIEVKTLELQFWRPEEVPAAYLGPHLCAVITNDGEVPVRIKGVHLVGGKSQTRMASVTEAPVSVDPGQSLRYAITLKWAIARRLRRDGTVVLEVEREDGQTERTHAVEIEDVKTWTPGEEVKASIGTVVVGLVWLFVLWGELLKLSPTVRSIAWPLAAAFSVFVCVQFYARLWRGEPMWGTGLTVGLQRRVRPLTDVLLTSAGVWVFLTAPFAFATYLIDGHKLGVGAAGSLFTGERERYFEAIGLYAWHAVDALPFVQATRTLRWTEPIQNYSRSTGALLVLYKALVLAPVVAAAAAAWRNRASRAAPGAQAAALTHETPETLPGDATSAWTAPTHSDALPGSAESRAG